MAERHPGWALGFADETWWSRFARPQLQSWVEQDAGPLRLIEQDELKGDPDPKALACYGVLLRQRGRAERLWLRFVDGRPVSAITEQFLGWCCDQLQLAGVRVGVLMWDNAGYHTSGGLVVPPNVSLIGLLPYSPELNPVENLWHYLRSHHWSHRVYRDYQALREAAVEAWRAVCLDPEKIRTICAAPYLTERG